MSCSIFTSDSGTIRGDFLDRYFAINKPFAYQQRISSRLVWQIVGAIWIFSLVMAFVPIHVGWNTRTGQVQNYEHPLQCVFELNRPYVLLISIGTYFGPLFVMCFVYAKVLCVTKKQVKEINRTHSIRAALPMLNGHSEESDDRKVGVIGFELINLYIPFKLQGLNSLVY